MKRWLTVLVIVCCSGIAGEKIAPEDKLRVKDAQLVVERAVNALLQSPQYAVMQAAQSNVATIIAEVEKKAGCKLDPRTVECVPPDVETAK